MWAREKGGVGSGEWEGVSLSGKEGLSPDYNYYDVIFH